MWCIYTLLRREGWTANHKRVHRIDKEEGMNLRVIDQGSVNQAHIVWNGLQTLKFINAGQWIL